MELLEEILIGILNKDKANIAFGLSATNILAAVESECYKTLTRIRDIVKDSTLDDFRAIEEIVCLFEKIGIDFGDRHDFG